ncbi:MAG: S9 family peptidase [Fimbriimonadaceae bacterium]
MPKRLTKPEDLLCFQLVGDPQISPDGERILFTKKHVSEKNKNVSNLFTVDLGGSVTQWTRGEGGDGHGRWSPDGSQIAFVSGREKPSSQIFLISTTGGEARKLTSLPEGSIGGFKWSPDGRRIAFLFRETHADWTEAAKKKREESGASTPPLVVDNLWYRLDGDGYFGGQRYAVYIVDVGTGEHRKLYSGCPLGWYSFDWSPHSDEIVVSHPASKTPFREPEDDKIVRVALNGQAWTLEGLPKGGKSALKWSPDGKWIAYVGHPPHEEDPWLQLNNRLWICSADGGGARCLHPNDDYCLTAATLSDTKDASFDAAVEWAPDSQALYVAVGWHGETQVGMARLDQEGLEMLTSGHHAVALGNVSRDGSRLATVYATPTRIPEVGVYEFGIDREAPRVLTAFNAAYHDQVSLSEPEEIWLDSPDGWKVHAWVMKPVGYLEPKRYPAILEVHGGPAAQYGWVYFHEMQLLAAQGYVVVYSNPRGSKGYGERHCNSIQRDWGNLDWIDIQTVVHWMQHQPYIHPGQMGIMGGSYGGYMTNWAVGHTDAFKAAITDRCVSNMVSMGGNSDFPFWRDSYFKGLPWGDLQDIEHLWKQSPIAYFKNVKTPMLIIHSEGDLRCNIEQSEQIFTALQQEGVESRFVRYPASTSHGMSRSGPADLRIHRLNQIVEWWKKFLG